MDVTTKAAERLRQLEADPQNMPEEYRTCGMHEQPVAVICDRADVSRAYLAEHPADDAEPLTISWLQSVLLRCNVTAYGTLENDLFTFRSGPDGAWAVWTWQMDRDGEACLVVVKTRGDVRRLAAALGIQLATP